MKLIMKNTEISSQIPQLTDFQKKRLYREILDFIQFNTFVQSVHFTICPVCEVNERLIIKKGFLNGKKRYQCKECDYKFVSTRRKLS